MAQNFLSCDREQPMLLPPDLREWLPEDHRAWFVLDAVEEMNTRKRSSAPAPITPLTPACSALVLVLRREYQPGLVAVLVDDERSDADRFRHSARLLSYSEGR